MEIARARCEICRGLKAVENSLTKHGWEENDRLLPAAYRRLWDVRVGGREDEPRSPRFCPLCATVYSYETRSEYLANGSEDEEELRRLTDAEARAWLGDAVVDALPKPLLTPLSETVVSGRVVLFSTGGEDLPSGWGRTPSRSSATARRSSSTRSSPRSTPASFGVSSRNAAPGRSGRSSRPTTTPTTPSGPPSSRRRGRK